MAATVEPGTPAPDTTPAPAATDRPKPGGKGSLADRMEAKGWTPEDVEEGAHGEARTEPVGEDKPKPKAAKKPAAEAKPDEPAKEEPDADQEKLGAIGLLRKLASENGFVVDDGKLTTKEKAEWRIFKQEQRNQLAQAEKEAVARIEQARTELAERNAKVEAFEAAIKNRDHNALAKAAGFEDWDKLQEGIVSWQDPAYLERKELREWKEKVEREQEQAAQQRLEQERQQAQIQAQNAYKQQLSGAMKASQDPIVAAMADDPLFVNAIHRIQQENWDGRETVTPEQAVRMATAGARVTLGEELKGLYERLGKAFGRKEAEQKPAPSPKPKIASTPKPGPSVAAKFERRQDRIKHYQARLSEAGDRDAKVGSAY